MRLTCAHVAHARLRAHRAPARRECNGSEFVSSSQFVNEVGKEKPPVIEMVSRSGEPQAMLCPALICDTCRQQVTGHGNVLWAMRQEPQWESSPLFVSHKGQCHRALKAHVQGHYRLADGWSQLWNEAGDFMRHLTHNADKSFADDPDGSYRIVPVIHPGKD